jgi:hypothetical protein
MHRRILRDLPLGQVATMLAGALHEACILIAHAERPEVQVEDAMRVVRSFLDGLRRP